MLLTAAHLQSILTNALKAYISADLTYAFTRTGMARLSLPAPTKFIAQWIRGLPQFE